MTKIALTVPEAAEAVGVTAHQIRAWIASGDLKAKRQNRRKDDGEGTGKFLIKVSDLEECVDRLPAA